MDKTIYTKNKYIWLLSSLGIFLFLAPFRATDFPGAEFFSSIAYSCILGTAIFTCRKEKHLLAISAVLSFPAVISYWVHSNHLYSSPEILLISGSLFYTFYIFIITREVLRIDHSLYNKLAASLCTYLMIGIAFTYFYTLLELKHPGSFSFPETRVLMELNKESGLPHMFDLMYHSFVTLSTLGYGDIHPRDGLSRMLCITEALIGQIYLVVIVAGIISSASNSHFHLKAKKNKE
ncbi:potassium channel family protein [Lentisphaera profundi]|uniref:Potassium channel family protein n=1 Tax=Lentisphaera profundi TaxID=1658616 RepID=A0ABY7VX20_9BACT|nr:potassium channel family protein [Lentisphaera profundi]WDE98642.1 potassium channel family protein [Lentisphaera profundi]